MLLVLYKLLFFLQLHVLFNLDLVCAKDDILNAFDLSIAYVDRRGIDVHQYSHFCNVYISIYFFFAPRNDEKCQPIHYCSV